MKKSIQEILFKDTVHNIMAMLSRPRCVYFFRIFANLSAHNKICGNVHTEIFFLVDNLLEKHLRYSYLHDCVI